MCFDLEYSRDFHKPFGECLYDKYDIPEIGLAWRERLHYDLECRDFDIMTC